MDDLPLWLKSIVEWLPTIYETPAHTQATVQVVVAIFAIVGGWFTYKKYRKEQQLKRAEFFLHLRQELTKSSEFQKISPLLHWDSAKLAKVPRREKQYVLLFYEKVALLVNSGLMSTETAHYMFGYDIIRIFRSKNFWIDDHLGNRWWELFSEFALQMESLEPWSEDRRWWLRFQLKADLERLGFFDSRRSLDYDAEIEASTKILEFVEEMKLQNASAASARDNGFRQGVFDVLRKAKSHLPFRRVAYGEDRDGGRPTWGSASETLRDSLKDTSARCDLRSLRQCVEQFNKDTEHFDPVKTGGRERQRYRTKKLKF